MEYSWIKNKIFKRELSLKRNIGISFIFKGLAVFLSFFIFPLTINYIDSYKYGVWMTISSMVSWFAFSDLGLGNGLRNNLVEAIANKNWLLARKYVSTTYASIAIIGVLLLVMFQIANFSINWNDTLKLDNKVVKLQEIRLLVLFLSVSFIVNLVLKLISAVLYANQKSAIVDFIDFIGQLLTILLLIILTNSPVRSSLVVISFLVTLSPVIVYLLFNLSYFKTTFSHLKPTIQFVDFSLVRSLLNFGLKFFFISIISVFIFSFNNFIIIKILGPEEVTTYNISFKYFGIIQIVFVLILTPFWSAFTSAWIKKEYQWIKQNIIYLIAIWVLFLIAGFVMLYFSNNVYSLWIGKSISIPIKTSLLIMLWILINSFNGIFSHFFNGIGKLRVIILTLSIAAITNIPLAFFLGKHFGLDGVLIANIISSSISLIIWPSSYLKLIYFKPKENQ